MFLDILEGISIDQYPKKKIILMKFLFSSLLITFLLISAGIDNSIAQTLRNQTLSAMGISSEAPDSELYLQQSIGQGSIAGTFSSASLYLSQGFLRGISTLTKEILPPFAVIAFPNAFTESIRFRFSNEQEAPTSVRVHDLQGKRVYEEVHQPKNREIELQLPFLAPGLYLVELRSGSRMTQIRILKK